MFSINRTLIIQKDNQSAKHLHQNFIVISLQMIDNLITYSPFISIKPPLISMRCIIRYELTAREFNQPKAKFSDSAVILAKEVCKTFQL